MTAITNENPVKSALASVLNDLGVEEYQIFSEGESHFGAMVEGNVLEVSWSGNDRVPTGKVTATYRGRQAWAETDVYSLTHAPEVSAELANEIRSRLSI